MGKGLRIGATIGILAGAFATWKYVMGVSDGSERARRASIALTGYDYGTGKWDYTKAVFTIPVVAGVGLSLVASKVGLNRYTPKGINI